MNEFKDVIHRVADDSYVITRDGHPYHVPKDTEGFTELWGQVDAYAKAHPEEVTEEHPYVPTAEELAAALQAHYTQVIQQALDDFARTRGYDHINSACTYATSTDPQFRLEGEYCVALRDETWRTGYRLLDEVRASERAVPSEGELLALLPVGSAKWPDEA